MKYIFNVLVCFLLIGCTNSEQSIVKTDDELTSNIKLLFDKYVENDFDVSDYYAADLVAKVNNEEINGLNNLLKGFKAHHELLYNDIAVNDVYVHTNYFSSGDIWSNAWFTWSGTGKTTGENYTNRGHFDYKWENGKIVELLAYFSEESQNKEVAALTSSSN